LAGRLVGDVPDVLRGFVREIDGIPSPGVQFKDITPLLADGRAWRLAVDTLSERVERLGPHKIAGIEARGFMFGASVAAALGLGFVPIRKAGKLPWTTTSVTYDLEYGTDTLEVHVDACAPGERVAIVDDVLATGGTAAATAELVASTGAEVAGLVFLVELGFLDGRARLPGRRVDSVIVD
jgi:adenine phosphoribosyltransferase